MATAANLASGATPTHSSHADPFVSTPSPYQSQQLRYATLDHDQFTSYSANSPAQARRALEAHLKETNRRMQDAAKLGATLVKQRDNFAARLKELESVKDDEVPDSLRQKLVSLEKEYNEVGRESARAFQPKLRPSTTDPTTLTGTGGPSPTKVSAPSRRQRNQAGNRLHDIEFATEISTSLLAQVRQLQAALADKDSQLRDTAASKAQIESEMGDLSLRMKQMEDRSQGFRDENWNLETRIQELESSLRDNSENHARLAQTLSAAQAEKLVFQRDLDDLRSTHDKALESHATDKKQQDQDVHSLRRDLAAHQAEKQSLQKQIEELNSNNKELARAVSYKLNAPADAAAGETLQDSDEDRDMSIIDGPEMSPIKGTPARPGMLESETLKSSLNHAHRMIQNLKNNIHREKTEKLELKRMLGDARDELERQRGNGNRTADKAPRTRQVEREGRRRPPVPGGFPTITTEILDDPEWEDNDDATPSRPAYSRASTREGDTTDAFETADERRETTETEGFETGHEAFDDDDSDALTETEAGVNRSITLRKRASQQPIGASSIPGDRRSFLSTASTSNSEDEAHLGVRTPSQGAKYRAKKRRSARYSQNFQDESPSNQSTPQNVTQTLGDELDGLDDVSVEGTPSKLRDVISAGTTPESTRVVSAIHTPARPEEDVDQTVLVHHSPASDRPVMVDAGMMTEQWAPEHIGDVVPVPAEPETSKPEAEPVTPKRSFSQRVVGVAGGALAGFGLGRASKERDSPATNRGITEDVIRPSVDTAFEAPVAQDRPVIKKELSFSAISHEEIEPVEAEAQTAAALVDEQAVPVLAEDVQPVREYVEPRVYGGGKGANGVPTLVLGDNEPDQVVTSSPARRPLGELSPNVSSRSMVKDEALVESLSNKRHMADEGSQTSISGEDIDNMLRNKSAVAGAELDSPAKRPGSSGSARNRALVPAPPLPSDHNEKIAAAAKTPVPAVAPGSMGPPTMPASAYRNKARPVTPSDKTAPRAMSRDGTTPRAVRTSVRDPSVSGRLSHRSSVSSFASELDARFNINREQLMYPDDIKPATDPRMIQAITQTMIGEYLWKYTRKAGRTNTSTTRHKRFFWVHPYTRTLYWSEGDPSIAVKGMMKAKSVPIESVRVITDDNVNPPGLHRKSIVVITPNREVVITAPTSQRHETWINSLSYLLLKSEAEKDEAEDEVNEEDLEEFNPGGFSIRRSLSRMARSRSRSRVSLNSYNSRTATRNSSPTRAVRESTISERPNTARRSQSSAPNAPAVTGSVASRTGKPRDSSRFSSISSRFGTAKRGSVSSAQPGRADSSLSSHKSENGVYNASAAADSAEDVRLAIAKQDRDAALLENVRACCDGKHDVGSLSRNSKHMSLRSRVSNSHSHGHSHAAAQPQPKNS